MISGKDHNTRFTMSKVPKIDHLKLLSELEIIRRQPTLEVTANDKRFIDKIISLKDKGHNTKYYEIKYTRIIESKWKDTEYI